VCVTVHTYEYACVLVRMCDIYCTQTPVRDGHGHGHGHSRGHGHDVVKVTVMSWSRSRYSHGHGHGHHNLFNLSPTYPYLYTIYNISICIYNNKRRIHEKISPKLLPKAETLFMMCL
jgi:hypothetical protein